MATTVGGALRGVLVATGIVNQRVFRDAAPEGATFPYVTFVDPVALVPVLSGDGVVYARRRTMQWDLWQRAREESDELLAQFVAALDGADLELPGRTLCRTRVASLNRVPDPGLLVVHHAVTVSVSHTGI